MQREKSDYNSENHWNNIYSNSKVETLGWFENNPEPSLTLIDKCQLDKTSLILNVGSGATTLVDHLLQSGYENLIVNDLSEVGLNELKKRIGEEASSKIKWIIDDLTNPKQLNELSGIDLWHDRAVLHFLLNESQQQTYFNLLRKITKQSSYVIIAVFNLDGAIKCSGLPVFRYNEAMLQEKLGKDFEVIEAFNYNYTMPSGANRQYIYTLFQRK